MPFVSYRPLLLTGLAGLAFASTTYADSVPSAHVLVRAAIDAMGGQARLRAFDTVQISAMRQRYALEQSVRPEGPYIYTTDEVTETRRFDRPALRDEVRSRGFAADWIDGPAWKASTQLVTAGESFALRDGALAPGSYAAVQAAEESLALGPERVLLTAAAASDLHGEAPEMLHGYAHPVVAFHWRGQPVRVVLEPVAHLPAAVETTRTRPYHVFWAPWGDVTTRLGFDVWMREANGMRYPRQWTLESNGRVAESWFIDGIRFGLTATPLLDVDASLLAKARASHVAIADWKLPASGTTVTLAPGIVQRPGRWNVATIDTADGTYVLEGPIDNAYSAQVIDEVQARGRSLLGVITTSDSWPHIGGLREYVARGVPIVALDLNRPQLQRLFEAPHRLAPDALARHPRPPTFQLVSAPRWLGEGAGRMRLIPFRSVTGERQFAVWWPTYRLLYTSDLFTVSPDGSVFLPQFLDETRDLVAREHLDVKTVFGMHYGPTDWHALIARVFHTQNP